MRPGEEDALERAEQPRVRGGRVGDGEEVVVEDRAAGALPVGPERVVRVCALGVGVDERRRGGVAREPELGVALCMCEVNGNGNRSVRTLTFASAYAWL